MLVSPKFNRQGGDHLLFTISIAYLAPDVCLGTWLE